MTKQCFLFLCAALLPASVVSAQDYKLEPVATPAPSLPASYAALIQTDGYRIVGPSGPWCEIWFRKSMPTGAKSADDAIAFPIAQGTLVGILRFPATGADRRGQTIKLGVYTLRYSDYPVDGSHQGVAPQRDFVLLTPIGSDPDPNATPAFDPLVQMSDKASGTPHPAVLSIETPSGSTFPALTKEGDHDWVLNVKIGDLPFAIIVAGKFEG
ncbi:MAG: hypothetical protein ABSH44_23410 [Bryobacteraceae bacterium]|jgi:hypothetical protein